jgi:pimeloyl-ACP methyl ester carboxylesterase
MIWIFVGIAALALAIAWPRWQELRRGLPDPARAPGLFAPLLQGETHYLWHGPARGPVAVCIHGLTTPSPIWDGVAGGLTTLGYRVLVYDQFGRGYSDSAAGKTDLPLLVGQLEGLLDHLGLTDNLTLVGYAHGGVIATTFAATHPERMKRLVLLASKGIVDHESQMQGLIRRVPLLGDWLFQMFGARQLRSSFATSGAQVGAMQLAELDRRGYLTAVMTSYRSLTPLGQEANHRAIGRADVPVVALWADHDNVVPLRAMGALSSWNRNARQDVIKGAGHGMVHTHASEVNAHLVELLRDE